MKWEKVETAIIEDTKRYETFSGAYSENDPMRYRIFEGQFIKIMKEVTHVRLLTPPDESPSPPEAVGETAEEVLDRHIRGMVDKDDKYKSLSLDEIKSEPEYAVTINAMREYAAIAPNGWISVEDAPPPNSPNEEESTPYMTFPHYIILRFYDNHFWKYNSKWETHVKHFPTHWQPLPAPPDKQ